MGTSIRGAAVNDFHRTQELQQKAATERAQTERIRSVERAHAESRAATERAHAERRAQDARMAADRAQAERRAQDARAAIAQEAERKRAAVPQHLKPGPDVRLPAYESQESLQRKGYPADLRSTVNPKSTPISYYDANKKNAEGRAAHDADPARKGTAYIPERQPNSYTVRAESNPRGSQTVGHAHLDKTRPGSSSYLFSPEAARAAAQTTKQDPQTFLRANLALPTTPKFVSEARTKPGNYGVELSFTAAGTPQAIVSPKNTEYSGTTPIKNLFGWLGLKK